jgi:hypothetical protein
MSTTILCLRPSILCCMIRPMKKTTEQRIGIGLTKEDITILAKLQKRFGEIGPTAVFRMALRALERQQ